MVKFTIKGQPFSKANSRQLVRIHGRMVSVKSQKALSYVEDALWQLHAMARNHKPYEAPVRVTMTIYYPDRRQDLDPSLVLDIMQQQKDKKTGFITFRGIYVNDRQVEEMHLFREIDKLNPRCEISVEEIQPCPQK